MTDFALLIGFVFIWKAINLILYWHHRMMMIFINDRQDPNV